DGGRRLGVLPDVHLPGVVGRPARHDRRRADDVPRRTRHPLGADDRRVDPRPRAAVHDHPARRERVVPRRLRGRVHGRATAAAARDPSVAARPRRAAARAAADSRAPPAGGGGVSALLEVDGLTKRFGGVTAVDGCSFSVPEGSVSALVGPNGSGKTTAFNLITGYARADAGSVRFAGATVRRPDPTRLARRGLTRTFQQARIFPDLTLVENMVAAVQLPWFAIFHRRVRTAEQERALELLVEFGLARLARDRAGTLSYGQKKLLEF